MSITPNTNAPISEKIMAILETNLPDYFSREDAAGHLNGLLSREYLATLEHRRIGPPVHYMGRRVYYVKEEFLEWLREYFGGMNVDYSDFSRRVRRGKSPQTSSGEAGGGA